MITLSEEESEAFAWWLVCTKEAMQRTLDHTKEKCELNSYPKGMYEYEKELYNHCVAVMNRIDNVLDWKDQQ